MVQGEILMFGSWSLWVESWGSLCEMARSLCVSIGVMGGASRWKDVGGYGRNVWIISLLLYVLPIRVACVSMAPFRVRVDRMDRE